MKNRFTIIIILAAFFTTCNNDSANKSIAGPDSTAHTGSTAEPDYPYTKDNRINWEINKDQKNEIIVWSVLKAMENLSHEEIGKYTADSVESNIDGARFKGTKAQLMQLNKDFFASLKYLKVKPSKWLSVINKDKTEEWVSVWYTQTWEDRKGKADSLRVFNDVKLVHGKIVTWNEYLQHIPKE